MGPYQKLNAQARGIASARGISVTQAKRLLTIGEEAWEKEQSARRDSRSARPCPGHRWRWLSHEEQECAVCGAIRFVPDL